MVYYIPNSYSWAIFPDHPIYMAATGDYNIQSVVFLQEGPLLFVSKVVKYTLGEISLLFPHPPKVCYPS